MDGCRRPVSRLGAGIVTIAVALLAGQTPAAAEGCVSARSSDVRVVIASPQPRSVAKVDGTSTLAVSGSVENTEADVPRVEVFLDGESMGHATVIRRSGRAGSGSGRWAAVMNVSDGQHTVGACARSTSGAVTGATAHNVTVETDIAAGAASASPSRTTGNEWIVGLGGFLLILLLGFGVFIVSAILWLSALRLMFGGRRRILATSAAIGGFIALVTAGIIPVSWGGVWAFVNDNWGRNLPLTAVFILVLAFPVGLVFFGFAGGGGGAADPGYGGDDRRHFYAQFNTPNRSNYFGDD